MGATVALQAAGLFVGLQAARAQAQVYEAQAQAYEEQKEMAKIESSQMEAERRDLLRRQLASLGTSMSSQGVALGTSPSVLALAEDEKKLAKNDIANIKLMGLTNRRKYALSASGARAGARATTIGGFAKTATGAATIIGT
jgi:DNA-binding transcriptional regulator PaaX|tara:strand:- start:7521 stop:7943 length:423 start_codon:yes stop_codon:yes gene_type:complete